MRFLSHQEVRTAAMLVLLIVGSYATKVRCPLVGWCSFTGSPKPVGWFKCYKRRIRAYDHDNIVSL